MSLLPYVFVLTVIMAVSAQQATTTTTTTTTTGKSSAKASGLTCVKYGPAYHKSDAGKVTIEGSTFPACTGGESSTQPCTQTCPAGSDKFCYNFYRDSGFGTTGFSSQYVEGGGSSNYGKSQGGCFDGKVDSKWQGTGCESKGTAANEDEIRQLCCSTANCNVRANSSTKPSIVAAFSIMCLGLLTNWS